MDRETFIKEQIEQGKDREAVRNELISQGENTSGLEEEYSRIVQLLGIPEPKPPVPDYVAYTANANGISGASVHVEFPSLFQSVGYGFVSILKKWKELLITVVLLFVPSLVFILLPPAFLIAPVMLGILFVWFALGVVVVSALLYAVVMSPIQHIPFLYALQWSLGRFFPLLWFCILVASIFVGGFVFFLIPGILIMLASMFAFVVYVREEAYGTRALLRSYDLLKGHVWSVIQIVALFLVVGVVFGFLIAAFAHGAVALAFALVAAVILKTFLLGSLLKLYEACVEKKPLFDWSAYGALRWLYRFLAVLGLLAVGAMAYTTLQQNPDILGDVFPQEKAGFPQIEQKDNSFDLGASDVLVQKKVESAAVSATFFHSRMGFYDGVCEDISVVPPVACKNSSEYFMLYAPLQESGYYCIDSYGFSGKVSRLAMQSCQ